MRFQVLADLAFIKQIPDLPGVYRYYDTNEQLLYVGKAINLAKRVRSYFVKKATLSPRISLMVSKISVVEITITENETSALLLESNLIKSQKPKYNIIFRDDKSYPYIKISRHNFPMLEYFRGKPLIGDLVFGPYPDSYKARETLDMLQRLFKLRTCSNVTFANRSRPCMLYQIDLCSAPCVGKISQENYQETITYTTAFLSGNYQSLLAQMSEKMYHFAENMEFEQAGKIRDKIAAIRHIQERQIISNSNLPLDADIILTNSHENVLFIYVITIRNGLYVGDNYFSHKFADTLDVMLHSFLEIYYADKRGNDLIYIDMGLAKDFQAEFEQIYKIKIMSKTPGRIGELVTMGRINLLQIIENFGLDHTYKEAVGQLSHLLEIPEVVRIECYDTSHNHGSSAIASMVVFNKDKIDNSLYRKFNLSDKVGGDDLLALEIVLRRRLANQDIPLPDIILVDGGKTQLTLAKNLIEELGLYDKIKVIAIFKGENRRADLDKVIITSSITLNFRDNPTLMKLLQALRDEAHRFAITGHRKKQELRMKESLLLDIPGIGAKKRKALMTYFGSSKAVAEANIEQLQKIDGIGVELANTIYNHFHNK